MSTNGFSVCLYSYNFLFYTFKHTDGNIWLAQPSVAQYKELLQSQPTRESTYLFLRITGVDIADLTLLDKHLPVTGYWSIDERWNILCSIPGTRVVYSTCLKAYNPHIQSTLVVPRISIWHFELTFFHFHFTCVTAFFCFPNALRLYLCQN